jgi:O-acetylserine/cysteine efflux transporter
MARISLRAAGASRAQVSLKPAHALLAILVTAVWGFNFVVIKVGVAHVPPLLLTGMRFLFAAIPAIFFVKRPGVGWRWVIGYGTFIGVLQFGLLFVSIRLGMSAALASVVMQLQVFFTIGFAAVLLGEKSKPVQILGAAIAFSGMGVIAASRWSGPELLPLILCLLAALSWGIANLIVKMSGEKNALSMIVWASLAAPLPLFVMSFLFEDHAAIVSALAHPSLLTLSSIAFLAWPATIFGFGVWSFLLSRYPANLVSPFALLVPVFGISSGVIFLGEPFGAAAILGSALVFSGLLLNVLGPRLIRPKPSAAPLS